MISNPEHEALLAESVGLAMLVVLDTVAPAERIASVLQDLFDVPFDQIGDVAERSSEAAETSRRFWLSLTRTPCSKSTAPPGWEAARKSFVGRLPWLKFSPGVLRRPGLRGWMGS